MTRERAIFSWSGGKDSALAFYKINNSDDFEVVCLQTTVTQDYDRVSMHGFRTALLEKQASSIGLPLDKIMISKECSNEEYESRVRKSLMALKNQGVTTVIFGDIFLEDLKQYREEKLAQVDLKAAFPLWKQDTKELANKFIDLGFRAIISCVDTELLDGNFSGRYFNKEFIQDLPPAVDSCGENGEFHSFVFAGPIFKKPIDVEKGQIILREKRFSYCDILPAKLSSRQFLEKLSREQQ